MKSGRNNGVEMLKMRRVTLPCLAYAVLAVIVLAPFLAVRVPALGDTLNHLARMHILAAAGTSPWLQRYYTVHWTPIPYLAMDAIVPVLARFMPIYPAGKVFVCACVLLPAVATATLHYAVHGRVSLVPAAAFPLCTNYLLAAGFLNYLFSASLAVLLFAAWIATATWPRWPRAAFFAPLLLALYFGHAFAALAYCLCVFGLEAARVFRRGKPGRSGAADLLAAAAQAVPALAFAATLHVSGGAVGALETRYGGPSAKLMALVAPMLFLIDPVHVASIAAAAAAILLARRHLILAPAIWPAALAVMLAACAMPHVLFSTWGTDLRLPFVAAMLLVGGTSVRNAGAWRWPAFALLASLAAARAADDWRPLQRVDAEIAETRQVLATLPRGARLLVVNPGGHGTGLEQVTAATAWHMPLTAMIDRDAFIPTLFTGLTTVQVRPAWRQSSTPNGLPVTPEQLQDGQAHPEDGIERTDGHGARIYWRNWPQKFDAVLVQHFDAATLPMPANLTLVARNADMDLYRIVPPAAGLQLEPPPPTSALP